MAPIGQTSSDGTQTSGSGKSSTPATNSNSSQVTKNMFLQLLVAQLKNQDPLQPADGTQFMTQLAQFQTLEQSMNTGQDVTAIRTDLDKLVPSGQSGGSATKS